MQLQKSDSRDKNNRKCTWYRRCDHKNLCGCPGYYITRKVSPKIRTSVPLCATHQSSTLSLSLSLSVCLSVCLSTHPYILGNKRKRKEAEYILYNSVVVFLCYTTSSIWCLLIRYVIDVCNKEPGCHQAHE